MNVTYAADKYRDGVNFVLDEDDTYDVREDGFFVWIDIHRDMMLAYKRQAGLPACDTTWCPLGGVNACILYEGVHGPDKHKFGEAVAAMVSIEFGVEVPYVRWEP